MAAHVRVARYSLYFIEMLGMHKLNQIELEEMMATFLATGIDRSRIMVSRMT
jgi:hypothetical protein